MLHTNAIVYAHTVSDATYAPAKSAKTSLRIPPLKKTAIELLELFILSRDANMSYESKYHTWLFECMRIIQEKQNEEMRKKILSALLVIHELDKQKKKKYRQKRYCVDQKFQQRNQHGFYHTLFPVISLEESRFRNYFRMTTTQFEELLNSVAPFITKTTAIRELVLPGEKLCLTLKLVIYRLILSINQSIVKHII